MKPEKLVTMHCHSCGADFKKQPIIMVDPLTGQSRLEEKLPKKCPYCRIGLVRHIMEIKLTFNVGKQLEKRLQTPQ